MTQTALVTGANRGIGEKIAEGLAEEGLSVCLAVRNPDAARGVVGRIHQRGGTAFVEVVDTGSDPSIAALGERLAERGVVIDVLVNNAAVLLGERILDTSDDDVVQSIAINVLGPLRLIRLFAPGMETRGYGRIVNLSSGWGSLSSLGPGAYGITKAALNAITVKVADELPPFVKVNAMCPGWVHTEMGGAAAPRTPAEGADTAIFLATLPGDGPTGGIFRNRRPLGWLDG